MTNTESRRITSNVLWNVTGQLLPLALAVFSIPILIEAMGIARFGILSIGWVTVGYLSVFDFGLGRALTRQVAARLGEDRPAEVPSIVVTAMRVLAAIGIAGAGAVILASEWVTTRVLNIPPELQGEGRTAFVLLGLALPFSVMTSGLRGVLEAFHNFRATSVLRLFMGAGTYLLPLLVLPFSEALPAVIGTLLAGRVVAWGAHAWLVSRSIAALGAPARWSGAELRDLGRLGGWLTISNLASPIMVNMDRFLLGAMISVSAVAYYATPADALTKFLVVPGAVAGVLYPTFARYWATRREELDALGKRATEAMFIAVYPMAFLMIVMARPVLDVWLGRDFAERSAGVVYILAFGVVANAVGQVASTLIQASGRPEIAAKLHLVELPVYLVAFVLLVRSFGIEGAALAWTGRMVVDAGALMVATRFVTGRGFERTAASWLYSATLLGLMGVATLVAESVAGLAVASVVTLLVFAAVAVPHLLRVLPMETWTMLGGGGRLLTMAKRRVG